MTDDQTPAPVSVTRGLETAQNGLQIPSDDRRVLTNRLEKRAKRHGILASAVLTAITILLIGGAYIVFDFARDIA